MRERLRVFGAVLRDPTLLRVELAYLGFNLAETATWIAILVFAYQRGGATAAGLVVVIQLVPSAVIAPLAAFAGDRFRRDRVLLAGFAAQSVSTAAAAAALLADGPLALIYVLATSAAVSFTFTRPAMAALLPDITRTPEDLTAANVASSIVLNVSILVGPALAGAILHVWSPGAVYGVMAVVLLASTALCTRLGADPAAVTPDRPMERAQVWREAVQGFRAIGTEARLRLLFGVWSIHALAFGALDILLVVTAISVLHLGQSGPGFLTAAVGAGGLVGAAAAIALVGRRRLTPALTGGTVLWGVGLSVVGVVPGPVTAPVFSALAGAGSSVTDVSTQTLLQRIAPDEVLGRVFGVQEGLGMAMYALGSILASGLVAALGARGALVVAGLMVPAATLLAGRRLMAIDAQAEAPDPERLAVLRGSAIFAPLPPPVLERLAAHLIPVVVVPDAVVIRQGDHGDRFYLVAEGRLRVLRDGVQVGALGSGDGFGEIALLRDVPRTASVVCEEACRLFALEREPFLEAVIGHAHSSAAAESLVRDRLNA
jgi:MFS family permease